MWAARCCGSDVLFAPFLLCIIVTLYFMFGVVAEAAAEVAAATTALAGNEVGRAGERQWIAR
jgi:hypothetical protein